MKFIRQIICFFLSHDIKSVVRRDEYDNPRIHTNCTRCGKEYPTV